MESGVFEYPSESGGGFNRIHPTQKPVKLIEALLDIHSNKDDLVLDPFSGSGSTAIAALNLQRQFIGFEINATYYKDSVKRISAHKEKLNNEL